MNTYLTFTSEADAISAEAKISSSLGLPNATGTYRWAEIEKAINEDLWFFPGPPAEGWGNTIARFTKLQMMNGIKGFVEMPLNTDWLTVQEEIR